MSANLDLVRSPYAAWERGDFGSARWADPEIEYVIVDGPDAGHWTRLDGMAAGFRAGVGVLQDARIKLDEYRELDAERVLALVKYVGRGKASGLQFGDGWGKGAAILHIVDGQVRKIVNYWDRAHADLGL